MKEPKDFYNDPQLTAYALGELEGEEHAAVEAALQTDAAARAMVDEIRASARQIEAALASEPMPEFKLITAPPARRAAIIPGHDPGKLDGGPLRNLIKFPQAYYLVAGLAAACFAVMLSLHERSVVRIAQQHRAIAARNEAMEKQASTGGINESQTAQDKSATVGTVENPQGYTEIALAAPAAAPTAENQAEPQKVALAKATVGAGSIAGKPLAEDEPIQLSTFGVTTATKTGYRAANSTAGARVARSDGNLPSAAGGVSEKDFARSSRTRRAEMQAANTEAYAYHPDSDFVSVAQNPLSTFALDVDTASYANVRRFLQAGGMPPSDAVRIEELVNYFPYAYAAPGDDAPLAATLEVAAAPWAPTHRLVRIGLKAREIAAAARPVANLVFLIDVSGSMDEPDKLPLLQQSMRLLLDQLRPDDRVAIVTYAGESSLALPSMPASHRREILEVLNALHAGGGTNGGRGLELAYDIAKANFITGGTNRVILATDGDFNVGVTSEGGLARLVEEKAHSGVALTALGFGTGNYKDAMFQQLAEKGHGNYGYVDTLDEAKKLLVAQVGGTLVTVAKNVKAQVEFNPAKVHAYRLIGYDDRMLKKEDFNNDAISAGDVGAGHTVTALYEIVPTGVEPPAAPGVDALKYGKIESQESRAEGAGSKELLTVKVRYTPIEGGASRRLEFPLTDHGTAFADASMDFKFAAAVAGFGMILRDSPNKGSTTLANVENWAEQGLGTDAGGYRAEFIGLVHQAEKLKE